MAGTYVNAGSVRIAGPFRTRREAAAADVSIPHPYVTDEQLNELCKEEERSMRLEGYKAIEYASAYGLALSKYADPVEDARGSLSVEEAREIAREDPSLIYVDVEEERSKDA